MTKKPKVEQIQINPLLKQMLEDLEKWQKEVLQTPTIKEKQLSRELFYVDKALDLRRECEQLRAEISVFYRVVYDYVVKTKYSIEDGCSKITIKELFDYVKNSQFDDFVKNTPYLLIDQLETIEPWQVRLYAQYLKYIDRINTGYYRPKRLKGPKFVITDERFIKLIQEYKNDDRTKVGALLTTLRKWIKNKLDTPPIIDNTKQATWVGRKPTKSVRG